MQDWLQFRSIIWVTLHRQDLLQWITGSVIHSCSLTDIGSGHQSHFLGCPRPFLAWTPQSPLPEADVPVSSAPSGPIRFGSFNHNRKLNDATLRLWADLWLLFQGLVLF